MKYLRSDVELVFQCPVCTCEVRTFFPLQRYCSRRCRNKQYWYHGSGKDRTQKYQSTAHGKAIRKAANVKHYRKRRDWLTEYKLERGCVDCGYRRNSAALQFDHVDPDSKEVQIGRLSMSTPRMLAEIAKCVVRCANCHFERHNPELTVTELA